MINNAWQDLHYAARQLRKTPGFFALAIATLAVGIGVNAAMFTAIDQTLLRRMPYSDAARLVAIEAVRPLTESVANIDLEEWRKRDRDFSQIAYYYGSAVSVDESIGSGLIYNINSSANLFSTLGVRPLLGRSFIGAKQKPGARNEVVISEGFWRNHLQACQPILGKKVTVGGQIYTIVGVMPLGFAFPANTREQNEIWTPLVFEQQTFQETSWSLIPIARLKPGVSLRQAMQNLNALQQELHKEDSRRFYGAKLKLTPYRDTLTSNIRPALVALAAAVGIIWLIACANVAGLMLTRLLDRRRELAIRAALGAGRHRLASQLPTESLLVSGIGGVLGLGLSQVTTQVLGRLVQAHLPVNVDLHISWLLLAVLFGGVLVSTALIGTVPAIYAASAPAQEGLKDGSARSGVSRRQSRIRDGFVVVQVAFSFVMLVSAALMLRSLYSLHHVPLGFQTKHVLYTSLFIPPHQYEKSNIVTTLYQPLLDRLRRMPGVEDAALTDVVPVQANFSSNAVFTFLGRPKPERGHEPQAALRFISPNIFSLLHIPLLRGRLFTSFDNEQSEATAVVNQSFVRAYLPHGDPIGQYIELGNHVPLAKTRIIGVTGDVHQSTLSVAPAPEIDISLAQLKPNDSLYFMLTMFMQVVVRTQADPTAMAPAIQKVLHEVNPDLALNSFTTLQQSIEDSFGSQTLAGRLLGLFACVALLIATAGLYGLLAYAVSQRTHEIGVRIALGARPTHVFRTVLYHAGGVTIIGLSIGLAGAWLAGDVLRSCLYGVGGHDGTTMATVGLVLFTVCLIAAYVPARRAASVDPVIALRHE